LLISVAKLDDLCVGFTKQWRIRMAKLKIIAAALLATAVIGAPAMAREYSHPRHRIIVNAAAEPGVSYLNGRACVPAPRVGAFATAPWGNGNIPCEPYGYGYGGGYGGYAWDY
jgi:hypothetical protein